MSKRFESSGVTLKEHSENSAIAIISLNRPEKRNALNSSLLESLNSCIGSIRSSFDRFGVVIIKSHEPGMFCAGADLKERSQFNDFQVKRASDNLRRVFFSLTTLPIPVIGCIDGHAFGGGTELALSCDLRVASSRAVFAMPETGHAIIPGAGGTQRLPRLIGYSNALDMILTGRHVHYKEAKKLGLVNYTMECSQDATEDVSFAKGLELATTILEKGPIATREAKAAIMSGLDVPLKQGFLLEELGYSKIAYSMDRKEGLKAFSEKRKPNYRKN